MKKLMFLAIILTIQISGMSVKEKNIPVPTFHPKVMQWLEQARQGEDQELKERAVFLLTGDFEEAYLLNNIEHEEHCQLLEQQRRSRTAEQIHQEMIAAADRVACDCLRELDMAIKHFSFPSFKESIFRLKDVREKYKDLRPIPAETAPWLHNLFNSEHVGNMGIRCLYMFKIQELPEVVRILETDLDIDINNAAAHYYESNDSLPCFIDIGLLHFFIKRGIAFDPYKALEPVAKGQSYKIENLCCLLDTFKDKYPKQLDVVDRALRKIVSGAWRQAYFGPEWVTHRANFSPYTPCIKKLIELLPHNTLEQYILSFTQEVHRANAADPSWFKGLLTDTQLLDEKIRKKPRVVAAQMFLNIVKYYAKPIQLKEIKKDTAKPLYLHQLPNELITELSLFSAERYRQKIDTLKPLLEEKDRDIVL